MKLITFGLNTMMIKDITSIKYGLNDSLYEFNKQWWSNHVKIQII